MVRPLMGTMARWFLLILSGCSLAISGPSPDQPRNKPPTCETSKTLIALDGVFAATMAVIALGVAGGNNSSDAIAPALFGTLFAVSAVHGNSLVNDCNREHANYDSAMAAHALPPDENEENPVIAARGAPGIAMQPAVALPSASGPPVPQQLAPPPQQAPAPAPRPAPAATAPSDEAWAAFWKEVP